MSEEGEKPQVLPGDLITRVGLYDARCGDIVRITGWRDGWWVSIWNGVRTYYSSDGRQRYDEGQEPNQWQLLHWVGPLPASEPEATTERLVEIDGQVEYTPREGWRVVQFGETLRGGDEYDSGLNRYVRRIESQPQLEPETTTEQLVEIEGQAADTPATGYTPPEGWRVLAVGELLQEGDLWVNHEGESRPTKRVGERVNDELYIRCDPIEPEPEPIQVREGRWRTRSGEEKNIRSCEPLKGAYYVWPWTDGFMTFQDNGLHQGSKESPNDLIEYLGPIEQQPQPQPQPEPVQVREGRWKTRNGDIRNVTPTPEGDGREHSFPWWDAQYRQTWTSDGRYYTRSESPLDLVENLGPKEQQPEPQPESQPEPVPETDAELRIRLLKEANSNQAETIGRLKGEARDLNMEIGGLQRQLLQRDARIRDLETIYSAATKSFEDANKANDALRVQVRILQQEANKKNSRIEFLETLDAGNAVAICDYKAKVEKLQGLVDTARGQLEAAATERDELRAAIDAADKQLDAKDAQIRDFRIELDAAQQVPRPLGDEERERIWNEATEAAGRQVVRWLRPLTLAFNRHPDALFYRMMALTIQVLPDVLPELLGYAVEDESLDSDEDCE